MRTFEAFARRYPACVALAVRLCSWLQRKSAASARLVALQRSGASPAVLKLAKRRFDEAAAEVERIKDQMTGVLGYRPGT